MKGKTMINTILDELTDEIIECKNLDQKYLISKGNANGFEALVQDKILPQFNSKVKDILPHHKIIIKPRFSTHFPDLDLIIDNKLYGIELKSRQDGSWKTPGGSVIESISNESYVEIYILFATRNKKKHETSYHVRYVPYWKVTEAIKVTHSPRFSINLDASSSVFSSNDDYTNYRKLSIEEKNQFIQQAFAKTISKPTWYNNPNNTINATLFKDLDKQQQNQLITEALILFPKDLLKQPRADYTRITKYFLSEHYLINPSTRDKFTGSGQKIINNIKFPKIIDTYHSHRELISENLKNNSALIKVAYKYWHISQTNNNALEDFKNIIDSIGNTQFPSYLQKTNSTLSQIIFG